MKHPMRLIQRLPLLDRLHRLPRLPRLSAAGLSSPRRSPGGPSPAPSHGPARLRRWLLAGVACGLGLTLLMCLPAAWVAQWVASASAGRLQLAEAQGTLWQGSAIPVLTGGPGSRDAMALPSRLDWRLSLFGWGLRLALAQDCCVAPGVVLEWQPGWGRHTLRLRHHQAGLAPLGQWPAAWLEGLGAPWNTVKPGGQLRLSSHDLALELTADSWQLHGQLNLELMATTSRLSPVQPLGSYRLTLAAKAAGQPRSAQVQLNTLDGALQLSGSGEWLLRGPRFRGEARAAAGHEAALTSLLNLIGRRSGAVSVISIG